MAIRIATRRRIVSEDNLIEKDGIMISTPQVEGFDEVYKRNYTRLSQYAFHIIHDKGDAEDLANEAFLVYYQHTNEMDIANPDAYLFKILRKPDRQLHQTARPASNALTGYSGGNRRYPKQSRTIGAPSSAGAESGWTRYFNIKAGEGIDICRNCPHIRHIGSQLPLQIFSRKSAFFVTDQEK